MSWAALNTLMVNLQHRVRPWKILSRFSHKSSSKFCEFYPGSALPGDFRGPARGIASVTGPRLGVLTCKLALLMSPLNNPPVAFDVVVVGSGGGPDETNLSASVYS